jgi:hypothetical protein
VAQQSDLFSKKYFSPCIAKQVPLAKPENAVVFNWCKFALPALCAKESDPQYFLSLESELNSSTDFILLRIITFGIKS